MTSTALAVADTTAPLSIPDPRNAPVPAGWFETVALPAILGTDDWSDLDEYEARLKAFASYVDSFDGDALEFEKALRIVEKRRGELLGDDIRHTHVTIEVSRQTATRWRTIARKWEDLWPAIRDAKSRSEVTQAAVLRRAEMGVHFTSATDDWSTPPDLFAELHAEFDFTLDVCASAANARVPNYFNAERDGLAQDWTGVCWMNPPYGDAIAAWIAKAHQESESTASVVVCLVPARTDTAWWWDHCRHAEIRFLRGRLKFGDGTNSAPFPSAVVVFGREPKVVWWER